MRERIAETLIDLMTLPGPTGREESVLAWLERAWAPHVKRIWRSRVGNLIAYVGGSGPRLLLTAHADELSFVVRSIDTSGLLWLTTGQVRGEPQERFPVGQPALVLGRGLAVEGIFVTATGHVVPEERRNKPLTFSDLLVDIGANSKQEVLDRGITVGASVIWNPPPRRVGTRLYGKAIDDRIGLALMTLLVRQIDTQQLNCALYFAATVQEENGLLGASSLRADLDVDWAIALDVGLVGDLPTVGEQWMPAMLGGGPQLVHKDSATHYDQRLLWRLAELADRAGIPVQHVVFERYGSDGAALIRQGIPTALLAVGARHTHAPFEAVDLSDAEATLLLLEQLVYEGPIEQ